MGTVSPAQVSDGTTMDASDVNNPINTIANEFNGNIDNSNIKSAAAIDASKLAGGTTGMFGAFTAYTASLTGITIGNGTLTASYSQIGKLLRFKVSIVFGTTTTLPTGADNKISTPVALKTTNQTQYVGNFGNGTIKIGSSVYPLNVNYFDTNTIVLQGVGIATTGLLGAVTTGNYGSPAAGSVIQFEATAEAA